MTVGQVGKNVKSWIYLQQMQTINTMTSELVQSRKGRSRDVNMDGKGELHALCDTMDS